MEKQRYLRVLTAIIKELRNVDPNMGIQTVHTLFVIAQEEGLGVTEIAKRTNGTVSNASYNVDYLSKTRRRAKAGYNLVDTQYDAIERRRKLVSLSSKGQKLINKLVSCFL